jgi:hypothetical protein
MASPAARSPALPLPVRAVLPARARQRVLAVAELSREQAVSS